MDLNSTYFFNPNVLRLSVFRKDILNWVKLYRLINFSVSMNDRTGTLIQPIKQSIYDSCAMPAYKQTKLTYKDCCDEKAKQLYDLSEQIQKPITVMWSGGIDSTNVIVSLLRNYSIEQLKDKVKIALSAQTKQENTQFYNNYILPNFEFVNSESIPWLMDGSTIIVTGELNDQLFGSDMIKMFLFKDKTMVTKKLDKDSMLSYINAKINDMWISELLYTVICESANKHGIVLEKNSDWFWWFNFCFKWQNVHFRIYCLTSPSYSININAEWDKTYMHHFYQTDNFQLWSMNNQQIREIDDWKQYKMQAKELIYEFDRNKDYLENKIKAPSLQTIFHQRILNENITSNFEIVEKFIPENYYNSNNMFIKN
jgi:hypothetical protein